MKKYPNRKIYKITNDFSDHVYIGSTCQPLAKRFYEHKKEARRGAKHTLHLWEHVKTSTYLVSRLMTRQACSRYLL